jgi:phage portal protein BeeE
MGLLDRIDRRMGRKVAASHEPFWELEGFRQSLTSTLQADREQVENSFEGYVEAAYKRNGPVFSCIAARQAVFSEIRFQFQSLRAGRPGDLFGSEALALLETPWPGGTTGELLVRMEQDASLAGNFYATTVDDEGRYGRQAKGPGRRIARLRPDWVTLIIDSRSGNPYALDARVVGLLYQPQSTLLTGVPVPPGSEAVLLLPGDVAHYSPIPDPAARFRGMSWLTPVIREISADGAATAHRDAMFRNGARPSMLVRFDREVAKDKFDQFVAAYKESHQGVDNAFGTLFLGGGADATPLTHDMKQLEFTATQGKGEARIASAAGVPPSWVGFSEGLQGSALNAGNFSAARRRFADGTIRPLWRQAAAAMQNLVPAPVGARLWFDTRDVAFLREDKKDAAEIQGKEAYTLRNLLDAGFTPDSAKAALMAYDWSLLKHSGLFSVQLQKPGGAAPGTSQTPSEEGT